MRIFIFISSIFLVLYSGAYAVLPDDFCLNPRKSESNSTGVMLELSISDSIAASAVCFGIDSLSQVKLEDLGGQITRINDESLITGSLLNSVDVLFIATKNAYKLTGKKDIIEGFVQNGGGLIVEQPDTIGNVELMPPGFEIYVNNWRFQTPPDRFIVTEHEGLIHPITQGLSENDFPGNFETVYDYDIGSSFSILIRYGIDTSLVALAAGEYGSGKIVLTTGNINSKSSVPPSNKFLINMFNWAAGNYSKFSGSVFDSLSVLPLNRAEIVIDPGNHICYTDSSGKYVSPYLLANAEYSIAASKEGYYSKSDSGIKTIKKTTSIVDFYLNPKNGALYITVLDSLNKEVISNANVKVNPGNYSFMTGANGTVLFPELPFSELYSATISKDKYNNKTVSDINLVYDEITNITAEMVPLPGKLYCTVIDSLTRKPVDSALVAITPGNYSGVTNNNGICVIDDILPGNSYKVTISKDHYVPEFIENISIISDGMKLLNVSLLQTPGSVSGRVKDSITGLPIDSAYITITPGAYSDITDNSGNYLISGIIENSIYTLTAVKAKYFTFISPILSVRAEDTLQYDILLAPKPGVIKGIVKDSLSGIGVPFAEITISPGGISGTADNNGNFIITEIPSEVLLSVTASKEKYADGIKTGIQVMPEDTISVNIILIPEPGSISGTVIDSITGGAIESVLIELLPGNIKTYSNNDGKYLISPVLRGNDYLINLSKDGYYIKLIENISVESNENKQVNVILKPKPSSIYGTVRESLSGEGIPGVSIITTPGNFTGDTDIDGKYLINGIPPWEIYEIKAEKQNFSTGLTTGLYLYPGDSVKTDFILIPDPGSVIVTVTDSLSGSVIDSVEITVTPGDYSAITDSSGKCRINNLAKGTGYSASASKFNYNTRTITNIEILSNEVVNLSFTLPPKPGIISGIVSDLYTGTGIDSAYILVTPGGYETYTLLNGSYALTGLLPNNNYTFTISKNKYRSEVFTPISIMPGDLSTLYFELEQLPGTVRGTVYNDLSGSPFAQVQMEILPYDTTVITNFNGEYIVSGLPGSGNYEITAKKELFWDDKKTGINILPDDTVEVDFILAPHPGGLSGVVIDSTTKKAVADADIILSPGDFETKSNDQGIYSFPEVVPGENYTISITKSRYYQRVIPGLSIASGIITEMNIALIFMNSVEIDQNMWEPEKEGVLNITLGFDGNKDVKIEIYNVAREKVINLIDEKLTAGIVTWNGKDLRMNPVASGIYFIYIRIGSEYLKMHRVIIVR